MEKNRITIRIGTNEHELAVRQRQRSKDLLIFLHGLGGSLEIFHHVWNHPGFEHFSLLGLDFLGFGDSDKPLNFSYKIEDQAKTLNTVIRSFADYHLHIIAHSMGGAVAMLMEDEILGNITSFLNLEGNLISEDCFLSRKAIEHPHEFFIETFFPKLKKNMSGLGLVSSDLKRSSPLAFYKSCKSLVRWSDSGYLMDTFKQLSCKKAYVYGDRNVDIEPLKRLGDIPAIEISNSGHMMMLDNPDGFYAKVISFLK